ncbi:MAG TPA: hypothetical protein VJA21_30145, partial [Verrucomicrobiae bacterium]
NISLMADRKGILSSRNDRGLRCSVGDSREDFTARTRFAVGCLRRFISTTDYWRHPRQLKALVVGYCGGKTGTSGNLADGS